MSTSTTVTTATATAFGSTASTAVLLRRLRALTASMDDSDAADDTAAALTELDRTFAASQDSQIDLSKLRESLRGNMESQLIHESRAFLDVFSTVYDKYMALEKCVSTLSSESKRLVERATLAEAQTAGLAEQATVLLQQRVDVDERLKLISSYQDYFIISEDRMVVLADENVPINEQFFDAFIHVKQLEKDYNLITGNATLLSNSTSHDEMNDIALQLYQVLESANNKMHRAAIEYCSNISDDVPDVDYKIKRVFKELSANQIAFEATLDDMVVIRREAIARLFNQALTLTLVPATATTATASASSHGTMSGSPSRKHAISPGNGKQSRGSGGGGGGGGRTRLVSLTGRPIELQAADPLRYAGDMLAWIHQAFASECELWDALLGGDLSSTTDASNGLGISEKAHLSYESRRGSIDSLAEDSHNGQLASPAKIVSLASRCIAAICGPLERRVRDIFSAPPSAGDAVVTAFQLLNLVSFYAETFTRQLKPRSGLHSAILSPTTAFKSNAAMVLSTEFIDNTLETTMSALCDKARLAFYSVLQSDTAEHIAGLSPPSYSSVISDVSTVDSRALSAPPAVRAIANRIRDLFLVYEGSLAPAKARDFDSLLELTLDPLLQRCGIDIHYHSVYGVDLSVDPVRGEHAFGRVARLTRSAKSVFEINVLFTIMSVIGPFPYAAERMETLQRALDQRLQVTIVDELKVMVDVAELGDVITIGTILQQNKDVSISSPNLNESQSTTTATATPASASSSSAAMIDRMIIALESISQCPVSLSPGTTDDELTSAINGFNRALADGSLTAASAATSKTAEKVPFSGSGGNSPLVGFNPSTPPPNSLNATATPVSTTSSAASTSGSSILAPASSLFNFAASSITSVVSAAASVAMGSGRTNDAEEQRSSKGSKTDGRAKSLTLDSVIPMLTVPRLAQRIRSCVLTRLIDAYEQVAEECRSRNLVTEDSDVYSRDEVMLLLV
ncbi:hypothetical protein GQ42DRAFT_26961 [Ramicandelaber brevisporus]|nr:hypothetical protein GQ42DRAFT_26961 [Ramicandelaber brevisporus]